MLHIESQGVMCVMCFSVAYSVSMNLKGFYGLVLLQDPVGVVHTAEDVEAGSDAPKESVLESVALLGPPGGWVRVGEDKYLRA